MDLEQKLSKYFSKDWKRERHTVSQTAGVGQGGGAPGGPHPVGPHRTGIPCVGRALRRSLLSVQTAVLLPRGVLGLPLVESAVGHRKASAAWV